MKATQQSSNKTQAPVENKSAQTKENEKPFEQAPSNNILKLSPPAGAGEEGGGAPPPTGASGSGHPGEGSNQLALRSLSAIMVQPKLKVSPAGDFHEQEADRIADAVTRDAAPDGVTPAASSIQRKNAGANGSGTVAPPAVQRVAVSPGRPLSAEARAYFEPRFGRDFSNVRVHTGGDAEAATGSINAEAFTAGNNIAFARGNYAPESEAGRKLMAHELVHVAQQEAGGVAEVSRKKKKAPPTPEEEAFNMLDQIGSSVLSLQLGDQSFWDAQTLISTAQRVFTDYEGTDPKTLPRTYGTQAMVLMNLFDHLQSKAELAERGTEGELLVGNDGNKLSVSSSPEDPWTSSKPRKVTDIAPYNDEVLLEELHQAATNELFLRTLEKNSTEAGKKGSKKKRPSGPPPVLRPNAVTLPPLSVTGSAPKSRALGGKGSTTISKSLGLLKSKSLNDILDKEQTAVAPYDKGSLSSHVDEVWYIAGRLYILDNTGHVKMSQKSAIRLDAIGLEQGATYFMVPASTKSVAGRSILFDFYRVDGGSGRSFLGINPKFAFDLFDLMARIRGVFKKKKAIAIVAAGKGQKTSGVSEGMDKFGEAMERVPGFMTWALKKEINRRINDPLSTVADIAFDLVVSRAAKYVPHVGIALLGVQLLELAAWFGDTANIAVYARTDDEITIAAQIFALRIAEEAVGEVISAGVGVVSKKVGGGKADAPSKSPDADVDAPEAPRQKKGEEPAPEIKPQEVDTPEVKTPPPDVKKPSPKKSVDAPKPATPKKSTTVPVPRDAPGTPPPAPSPKSPDVETPKTPKADAEPKTSGGEAKSPEAAPPGQKATPAKAAEPVEMGDVVDSDGKGINAGDPDLRNRLTPEQKGSLDRLKDAYSEYKAREDANVAKGTRKVPVLGPEAWLKAQTSGKSRQDAVTVLGPNYAKAPKKKKSPRKDVDFKKINKPANADDAKMSDAITKLEKEPGRLWERLGALRPALAKMTQLDPALFNIIKGNIGEILALPIIRKALAGVRKNHPDAQLYEGIRVAQVNPDGGHDAPKLFSDGLIGEVKNGVLHIYQVFETKSGSQGGAEARSQFFEWREGRFNDGDKIIMKDPVTGKDLEFTYDPSKKGKGLARGVQTSIPVVIATSDAVSKGAGTSQNVAQNFKVESLGITAQELAFLARRILERESARQAKKASEAEAKSE